MVDGIEQLKEKVAQLEGERGAWIERVKQAEYVTRECVRMLDLMDGYLRDHGGWSGTEDNPTLRGGYKRVKALADPKGALVHEFEIDQLRAVAVAARAAYDVLAGLHVAHHPEEPMGSWIAELRDLGNALVELGE